DRASREEDAALVLGNRAGDELRIEIEDEPAASAHGMFALIGGDGLARERRAAERAEARRGRRERAIVIVIGMLRHPASVAPCRGRRLGMKIDRKRLEQSIEDLGRIGATPRGGLIRLALSDEDKRGVQEGVTYELEH